RALAALPVLVAGVDWLRNARWSGGLLLAVLIVGYGAAVTSFGLAVAVCIPRLGRALAVSVGGYVLIAVGWLFAMIATMNAAGELGRGLASASPLYGVGWLTAGLEFQAPSRELAHVF